ASLLLAPSIESISNATGTTSFDFWKFMNWVCVSQYWLTLYDLGQVRPVLFANPLEGESQFSQPVIFPSTNNIFLNASLFEIYSSWLPDVVLPVVQLVLPETKLPSFMPISDSNKVEEFDAMFYRSYPCVERRLKSWFSLIISVFAAN